MSLATETTTRTLALVGNPNTGKSTIFGALCGIRQRVGNYPGVTVEKKTGRMTSGDRSWTLIDLPGTYSLAPRSPDEMIAVDVLLGRRDDTPGPDVILCVVDASNLERNLYLVSQVLELGRPTVIALTMTDIAASRGQTIDIDQLSERLGIPVAPVKAHRRQGLDDLKRVLNETAERQRPAHAAEPIFPDAFRAEVERLSAWLAAAGTNGQSGEPPPRYLIERLLLDSGGYVERRFQSDSNGELGKVLGESRARLAEAGCPVPAVEAVARYGWAASVLEGIVERPDTARRSFSDRVDRVLTHRFFGTAIFAILMAVIFQSVFSWAIPAMDFIGWSVEQLGALVAAVLPEGPLRSLIADGVIAGVGAVVVFLPQIFILFFFLGILEDCGYLARAAYLMDRLMTRVGLSGKSFIPLLSSFACAIPGVMAARVIEDRRDRLATILVAPLMSCSARLPVYTLLIAAFIPARTIAGIFNLQALAMVALYALGIVVAAAVALILKRTIFKGPTPPFVMELPEYKWPSPRVVIHRMLDRGWAFIRRAGTIIVAVSIVMWALLYYPRLPDNQAQAFAQQRAQVVEELAAADTAGDAAAVEELTAELEALQRRADGLQKRQSWLGRAGRWVEPAVRPLGWDWRIGAASIASFPAREVVVATMGVIFDVGDQVEDDQGQVKLRQALQEATWPDGTPLFTIPVALSILVFFALCAQCVSTLAVIRRETNSWLWPLFSFTYMTTLAYLGALVTYQLGTWISALSGSTVG